MERTHRRRSSETPASLPQADRHRRCQQNGTVLQYTQISVFHGTARSLNYRVAAMSGGWIIVALMHSICGICVSPASFIGSEGVRPNCHTGKFTLFTSFYFGLHTCNILGVASEVILSSSDLRVMISPLVTFKPLFKNTFVNRCLFSML